MPELSETLLNKKLESYGGSELKDFQAENELLVEITLNEYRELIKEKTTKDYLIGLANKDKYTREDENKKLKQENQELKKRLFEYRKLYGELKIEEEREEE